MDEEAPPENSVSLADGYWFFFEADGDQFTLNASSYSGRDRVWVNDELVSDKRSWKTRVSHDFEFKGRRYEMSLEIRDLFTALAVCTLVCDGQVVGQAEQMFGSPKSKVRTLVMQIANLIGFAVGVYLLGQLLGRLLANLLFNG